MYISLYSIKDIRVKKLAIRTNIAFGAAVGCWISDRLFCDTWSAVSFPYLHGVWHLIIAITSYTICVIFSYIDAAQEAPESLPAIRYWPMDSFELGVPYVVFKNLKAVD